jgi:hypothetical protein
MPGRAATSYSRLELRFAVLRRFERLLRNFQPYEEVITHCAPAPPRGAHFLSINPVWQLQGQFNAHPVPAVRRFPNRLE